MLYLIGGNVYNRLSKCYPVGNMVNGCTLLNISYARRKNLIISSIRKKNVKCYNICKYIPFIIIHFFIFLTYLIHDVSKIHKACTF